MPMEIDELEHYQCHFFCGSGLCGLNPSAPTHCYGQNCSISKLLAVESRYETEQDMLIRGLATLTEDQLQLIRDFDLEF